MSSSEVGQAAYLRQFHEQSRLSFIGGWAKRYKDMLPSLQQLAPPVPRAAVCGGSSIVGGGGGHGGGSSAQQLPQPAAAVDGFRAVLHVDMDAFFASVALRSRPELRDKPVVVSANSAPGSEIACASYPARAFGVRANMSLKRARDLCPNVVQLPYDFDAYGHVAELMYSSLWRLSPFVLGMSCDEAYVDVTHLVAAQPTGAAREAALMGLVHELRAEIRRVTGCAASVGVSSNMLLAKVATGRAKPDGAFRLDPQTPEGQRVLGLLPLRELPQVGWRTGNLLESRLGPDATVRQLAQTPIQVLRELLGDKRGEMIWRFARGEDTRPWAAAGGAPQSVGAQASYGVRTATEAELIDLLRSLCACVEQRCAGSAAGRLTLTMWRAKPDADPSKSKGHLGHGQCDIVSRSTKLSVPVVAAADMLRHVLALWRLVQFAPDRVRGAGVQAQDLTDAHHATSRTIDAMFKAAGRKPAPGPAKGSAAAAEPLVEARLADADRVGGEELAGEQSVAVQSEAEQLVAIDDRVEAGGEDYEHELEHELEHEQGQEQAEEEDEVDAKGDQRGSRKRPLDVGDEDSPSSPPGSPSLKRPTSSERSVPEMFHTITAALDDAFMTVHRVPERCTGFCAGPCTPACALAGRLAAVAARAVRIDRTARPLERASFLEACRAYCQMQWPDAHTPFSDAIALYLFECNSKALHIP
jgi:nucleotidyltransferase/DNA polymerase involved in DNA repair